MSNVRLGSEQQQFIDDFAHLLLHWGLPITSARLYAYLLLAEAPVTLDEFAASLGISKSNASVAARALESSGMARRQTDRGSKRIRYEVIENPAIALKHHADLLGRMASLVASTKDSVASGANLRTLNRLAELYVVLKQSIELAIEDYR